MDDRNGVRGNCTRGDLNSIVKEKEGIVAKNKLEIHELQKKIKAVKCELSSLKEIAAGLMFDLRGKEKVFVKLEREQEDLLSELAAKKTQVRTFKGDNKPLELFYSKQKEKLKLMNYENSLKDREIAKLERKVDLYLEGQTTRSFGFLESKLTRKAFGRIHKHAALYAYHNRGKERSSSIR